MPTPGTCGPASRRRQISECSARCPLAAFAYRHSISSPTLSGQRPDCGRLPEYALRDDRTSYRSLVLERVTCFHSPRRPGPNCSTARCESRPSRWFSRWRCSALYGRCTAANEAVLLMLDEIGAKTNVPPSSRTSGRQRKLWVSALRVQNYAPAKVIRNSPTGVRVTGRNPKIDIASARADPLEDEYFVKRNLIPTSTIRTEYRR